MFWLISVFHVDLMQFLLSATRWEHWMIWSRACGKPPSHLVNHVSVNITKSYVFKSTVFFFTFETLSNDDRHLTLTEMTNLRRWQPRRDRVTAPFVWVTLNFILAPVHRKTHTHTRTQSTNTLISRVSNQLDCGRKPDNTEKNQTDPVRTCTPTPIIFIILENKSRIF